MRIKQIRLPTNPVITDFTNANHDHEDVVGGGKLDHITALTNIGINSHEELDAHLADDDQAHADYLKNDEADVGIALILTNPIPLTLGAGAAGVDYKLKFDGETNDGIFTYMEDEDRLDWDGNFKIDGNTIFDPSTTQNITAAGGITVINTEMHIQGDGGPVDITANPQIAAGTSGQIVLIEGQSDTNTVTLESGNGLHLHGKAVLTSEDIIMLHYEEDDSEWQEVTRNFPESEQAWSFISPTGGSGTFYVGGYYLFGATDNDFNPSITHGTANSSYAAHIFLVQAAGGGGGTDTVIRVTGTSITDAGVRTTSDTEDLTVDDAGSAGDYYETTKKWIGQVTIAKQSGPDLLCNYGFAKYWDNNNSDFIITGVEVTGRAGANDTNPNISIRHHKATGWTYNTGSTPSPPTAVVDMNTDHNTEIQYVNGENFAWKRDNLSTNIDGGNGEGSIIEFITTANKSIEMANVLLRVRPN